MQSTFVISITAAAQESFGSGRRALQAATCLPPLARNYRIFQDRGFSEQETVTKAIGNVQEWLGAQINLISTQRKGQISRIPKWLAMRAAMGLNFKHISFKSDSKNLVIAITEKSNYSDIHGIISNIISISFFFRECIVTLLC
ncbi:unnamed protein product [Thlaspi arvense]|uniref:RNase H type-1 domain-containing protein n=1 Tax=Thlaspi arvense TaxID=13288 RepID=A0AAU9RNY2_THLAR|nr:unnamed protein product [Thlaspi arvense]